MAAQRSPVILYEDDKPLGPAHALHDEVEHVGRGRYAHWKDIGILMSTSDNTDPNRNGRLYWIGLPRSRPSPVGFCEPVRFLPLQAGRP